MTYDNGRSTNYGQYNILVWHSSFLFKKFTMGYDCLKHMAICNLKQGDEDTKRKCLTI